MSPCQYRYRQGTNHLLREFPRSPFTVKLQALELIGAGPRLVPHDQEDRDMRHLRFSIRDLMVVIVLLCVAFAALRFPTPLWANFWFSLNVAALTLAVPAAVS